MNRVISYTVIYFLSVTVNYSTAISWRPLKSGESLPLGLVPLANKEFVGRAWHYDELLPAAVNSTHAIIESCGTQIAKHRFDILLLGQNNCRWQRVAQVESIPQNIVRGGTSPSGEPIYIGRTMRSGYTSDKRFIESVYLFSKTKNKWNANNFDVLVCDEDAVWVDTAVAKIPNNTVSGGRSAEGSNIYVARLKSGCSIIPGQAVPESGVAMAEYKHEQIVSRYCQVLVADSAEYIWEPAVGGDIPDNAVAASKEKGGELMYVALVNKKVGYLIQSEAAKMNLTYNILTRTEP